MKLLLKSIVFSFALFFNTTVSSQKMAKPVNPTIYKWEGYSNSGHIVYGIAPTRDQALSTIKDFNKRNKRTVYRLAITEIKQTTTSHRNLLSMFYKKYPKKYRILKYKDITTLYVYNTLGYEEALTYLINSNDVFNVNASVLDDLIYEHENYRFRVLKN